MRQDSSQIDQRSNQNRSHYRGKRKEVRTDVRTEASTVGKPQQEEEPIDRQEHKSVTAQKLRSVFLKLFRTVVKVELKH